jgi:GT2 family glycosyltransferase
MPDFDHELSITILSWNTQDDLRACLASLQNCRADADFEVIVVDNNSEDGSPDMVEREFEWVRLYRMDRNLGFCAGHNFAVAQRKGRHAFLLNSDTIVHPGALSKSLEFMRANPDVGIVGPKLLNSDGSLQMSCRKFPNPVAALFRNTPLGRLFPNNRFTREYLMTDFHHDKVADVDWVSGAAVMVRDQLIEESGVFDEGYFMFCEDIDLCWRAWKAGFRVVYLPDAVVTHAIGRSTDKAPNRMIGRHHRSMLRFYKKNMLPEISPVARPFAYSLAALAVGLRASVFIVKNKIDVVKRSLAR